MLLATAAATAVPMVTIPESETARIGELSGLLRIQQPGNFTQVDKLTGLPVPRHGLLVKVRQIQCKQWSFSVKTEKYQLLEGVDVVGNAISA